MAEAAPADPATLIRVCTVIELDPAKASCRVRYGDPEDEDGQGESGWIAWLAPRAGETRVWSAPSEGEQGLLLCPDGQLGAGVFLPGLWRDQFTPPSSGPEDLIEWEDSARISYDPDAGELVADLPAGATVRIVSPGGVTIEAEGGVSIVADVTIDGNVSVTGTIEAQGDVTGEGVSLATHRHSGVQVGGSQTGEPV